MKRRRTRPVDIFPKGEFSQCGRFDGCRCGYGAEQEKHGFWTIEIFDVDHRKRLPKLTEVWKPPTGQLRSRMTEARTSPNGSNEFERNRWALFKSFPFDISA